MNLSDLSNRELMIMKCLWTANEPVTVNDLIRIIQSTYHIAYRETTIYTFLKRLKDKQYVTAFKRGSSYFSPSVSEYDFLVHYAETLADFLGKRSSEVFLRAIRGSLDLDDSEWNSLLPIVPKTGAEDSRSERPETDSI